MPGLALGIGKANVAAGEAIELLGDADDVDVVADGDTLGDGEGVGVGGGGGGGIMFSQ